MAGQESRRVLVMAGGTGGHVFPALAVAEELRRRGVGVTWLGTRRGIEARLVPERGFPIRYIDVAGLRGTGWRRKLAAPVQLLRALCQALAIVRAVRPNMVLGLGGFASGPGGLAAWLCRKPLVIHEQNAVAGTTNRILAILASRVLVAFSGALRRGEWCGNPVRREITLLPAPAARMGTGERRLHLLVLGGSLGAQAINGLVPEALGKMSPASRPLVRHQAGERHLQATRAAYRAAGVEAEVQPFIEDMASAYGWADLVVCRAGALTISELAAAGVGAILVPFPHAIDDHQTRNGEVLTEKGAAVLVQQKDLDGATLQQLLEKLLGDRIRLRTMAENARSLARPFATTVVADVCEEVMP